MLFGNQNCQHCYRFQTNPNVGALYQLKFVDRTSQHRNNRLEIDTNFVETLPESNELEQLKTKHEFEVTGSHADTVEFNLKNRQCKTQTGKLQKVLADLRVLTLPISNQVRK